jgi:hypothetical protein
MVNSFFIALAFAIGSAIVLLSILYLGVRIFAPQKLDERIPGSISIPISIQEPTAERSVEQPTLTTTIRALASYDPSLVPIRISGDNIVTSVAASGLETAAEIKRLSQLGHNVPMLVLTTLGPYPGKAATPQERPHTPFSQTNPEIAVVH